MLDVCFRELHQESVGASKKSSESAVISFKEKQKLWETSAVNTEHPQVYSPWSTMD